MKPQCVTIQMKAIEQYCHVVLFIMLYRVVITCNSVDENLVCDYSNEAYSAVLYFDQVPFIMNIFPVVKIRLNSRTDFSAGTLHR